MIEFRTEFRLRLIQFRRRPAHFGHLFDKLTGCALSKFIGHLFEFTFGADSLSQCLRDVTSSGRLGGSFQPLPRRLKLLLRVAHFRLLSGRVHTFLCLVGISQEVFLLVSQTLQLSLQFFLLFGRGRFLQGKLQFSQLLIDVFLSPRQIAQSTEDLLQLLIPLSVGLFGANSFIYWDRTFQFLEINDVTSGLVKAAVFGLILAVTGCAKGYFTAGGAEGVGRATTAAVVMGCMYILISDFFLTKVLF